MIVRQIGAGEIAPAIQLIWDTFYSLRHLIIPTKGYGPFDLLLKTVRLWRHWNSLAHTKTAN